MMKRLEPVLFAADDFWVRKGLDSGMTTMIVDWEDRGKATRQQAWDTEVNCDTPQDLERLRWLGVPNRLVRVNAMGPWTENEVEVAIAAGATCILLPMVTNVAEVQALFRMVAGRSGVGILAETMAAVDLARDLGRLPLACVYVGLNDLAIDRGLATIFESIVDGTVDRLRDSFASVSFGFGGLTVLDRGSPVPFRLLLAEICRLRCDFSFCRRSFKRDVIGRDIREELEKIEVERMRLLSRSEGEINEDRQRFGAAVKASVDGRDRGIE